MNRKTPGQAVSYSRLTFAWLFWPSWSPLAPRFQCCCLIASPTLASSKIPTSISRALAYPSTLKKKRRLGGRCRRKHRRQAYGNSGGNSPAILGNSGALATIRRPPGMEKCESGGNSLPQYLTMIKLKRAHHPARTAVSVRF